jgi:hypothetical protein
MNHRRRSATAKSGTGRNVERKKEATIKQPSRQPSRDAKSTVSEIMPIDGKEKQKLRFELGSAVERYLGAHFVAPAGDEGAKTAEQIESNESKRVLLTLREARMMANECRRDCWDFAVEINELTELGVPRHILRKLVCQRLVEHRREVTIHSGAKRSFEPESAIVLTKSSCFVLTAPGVALANQYWAEAKRLAEYPSSYEISSLVPNWDEVRREFCVGDITVKRYKWPAKNQQQVLNAFQLNKWPYVIDNPITSAGSTCPRAQLHDTIKCLNRNQINKAVRFHGDGTGNGVYWEIIADFFEPPRN